MSDSPRLPARSVVVVLFVVAACAVLAAGGLTAAVLADASPREAAPVAAGRPSPTARADTTRPVGPPLCLIGSWRTVQEQVMVKFYNNEDPLPFVTSGRAYEFRPDGTGTERMDDVVFQGTFQGNELRLVGNGIIEFTWSATEGTITYGAPTKAEFTWAYYDQRGLVETQTIPSEQARHEVDDYACQGAQLVESNSRGYRSVWARTTGFGVYG
ncbi:hypothetical protein IOD16_11170 [Saccharothrix sp. 6-C]|uniref:lipocalin family protein n=1 Tax=Saccharothrix sp. 6-C TaxID=2781735 RepID=UPI0019179649|nr:lipocalin family protein [Saccharothrix sp. 6-C]QQQ78928.1 hypothetical protein IOD16_11170 [Saccharothrix sp. 6-C]